MASQKPSHTFTKIHLKALRTNNIQILFALSFTVFINTFCFAQDIPKSSVTVSPETTKDSLKINVNTIAEAITSEKSQDSTLQDSVKPKQEFLPILLIIKPLTIRPLIRKNKNYIYITTPRFIMKTWKSLQVISLLTIVQMKYMPKASLIR